MTLEARRYPKVRKDYLGMRLKYYSWMIQKPRVIGHVSDLIMCLRERVFRELDPRKPTKTQMMLYSSGGAIHSKIQGLQGYDPAAYETEYKVFYKGLSGSVDCYDKVDNVPMEYKTPRKNGPLREPQSYNVEQLKTYMSILGSYSGYLEYTFITSSKNENPYQEFWIDMTPQEHREQLDLMLTKLHNLKEGVEEQEPALTAGVYNDPAMKWLCNNCPYREPCELMR